MCSEAPRRCAHLCLASCMHANKLTSLQTTKPTNKKASVKGGLITAGGVTVEISHPPVLEGKRFIVRLQGRGDGRRNQGRPGRQSPAWQQVSRYPAGEGLRIGDRDRVHVDYRLGHGLRLASSRNAKALRLRRARARDEETSSTFQRGSYTGTSTRTHQRMQLS